jgi:Tol biopolymer transport system component
MAVVVLPPDLSCPEIGTSISNLYLVHRDGREQLLAEGYEGQATWSADGSKIVAFPAGTAKPSVSVIEPGSGSKVTYEFPEPSYGPDSSQLAVWSPSGRYLAINEVTDEGAFEHRIVVLDLEQATGHVLMDDAYAHAWLAP